MKFCKSIYSGGHLLFIAPTILRICFNCPVKIYYKNEGVSPAGSHKPNAAIPMAYYNKVAGTKRMNGYGKPVPDNGGSALANGYSDCSGWHVAFIIWSKSVMSKKPYRRMMMNILGSRMYSQPQYNLTASGKKCFG